MTFILLIYIQFVYVQIVLWLMSACAFYGSKRGTYGVLWGYQCGLVNFSLEEQPLSNILKPLVSKIWPPESVQGSTALLSSLPLENQLLPPFQHADNTTNLTNVYSVNTH